MSTNSHAKAMLMVDEYLRRHITDEAYLRVKDDAERWIKVYTNALKGKVTP